MERAFYLAIFFSELEGRNVFDVSGVKIGTVHDVVIKAGERCLEVSGLIFFSRKKEKIKIPLAQVEKIKGEVRLKVPREDIPPGKLCEGEMLLKDVILDNQIVDINGLKVVRVNDVVLDKINSKLCIVAVDAGVKGLFRRLGLEKALKTISPSMTDYCIPWHYVESLQPELCYIHLKIPRQKLADLHPADIADILEELGHRERTMVMKSLDTETAAETLEEVAPEVQKSVVEGLKSEKAADIIESMAPDEAADLLKIVPEEKAEKLLDLMEADKAADVRALLAYPEKSAGGIMTTEYVAVSKDLSVEETFSTLRGIAHDCETIYYVYMIDEEGHLIGTISLRDLLISNPSVKLSDIMTTKVERVTVNTALEHVANLMAKYDLLTLPVVDDENHLKGIVTIDDALDMIMPENWKKQIPRTFRHKKPR